MGIRAECRGRRRTIGAWAVLILALIACRDSTDTTPSDYGVPVDRIEEEAIHCLQPEARDLYGPLYQPDLGEAWNSQLYGDVAEETRRDSAGVAVADHDPIDRITIHWPDGEQSVIHDIGTDWRVWILREGASRLPGMPG